MEKLILALAIFGGAIAANAADDLSGTWVFKSSKCGESVSDDKSGFTSTMIIAGQNYISTETLTSLVNQKKPDGSEGPTTCTMTGTGTIVAQSGTLIFVPKTSKVEGDCEAYGMKDQTEGRPTVQEYIRKGNKLITTYSDDDTKIYCAPDGKVISLYERQ